MSVDGAPRSARRRSARYAAIAVAVVAAILIGVLATRSVPPGTTASSALIGKPAPTINGNAITTRAPVSLAALRGRFVVVDFFASWCQPCLAEAPQLEAFLFAHHAASASPKVAILGVDIDDSAANGAAFLRRTGATYPAIEDTSGSISLRYGVADPPQSFLVAPSGRVVARILDGISAAGLDTLIGDYAASYP